MRRLGVWMRPMRYPHPGPLSSLLGEQGLSLWIELPLPTADLLVLSHGHVDHYGGPPRSAVKRTPLHPFGRSSRGFWSPRHPATQWRTGRTIYDAVGVRITSIPAKREKILRELMKSS